MACTNYVEGSVLPKFKHKLRLPLKCEESESENYTCDYSKVIKFLPEMQLGEGTFFPGIPYAAIVHAHSNEAVIGASNSRCCSHYPGVPTSDRRTA